MKKLAVFCLLIFLGVISEATSPKGVILVLVDDIGYGDINVLEPTAGLSTPHLDRLYGESVRFTDFHVGTTCSPSRGSLMTGRYINAGGVQYTIAGRSVLFENEQTMADVFKANGWSTGIFGKWHLGDGYPYLPRFRGFETSVIHGGGGVGQMPDYWGNDYYFDKKFDGSAAVPDVYFENGKPVTADAFCTDYWFKRAKEFIKSSLKADKKFFCYLPTNAAHSPFNAPHGGKPGFDGLIENLDLNMGGLEEFLIDEGIRDDVLLIFTTDNGTTGSREGGLRGRKGSCYDGGHCVPCFWRWRNGGIGGSVATAKDVESLTVIADFLPTFIEMFALRRPAGGLPLHGVSMKEMLLNPQYQPVERSWVVDTQRGAHLRKWRNTTVLRDVVVDGSITRKWRLVRTKDNGAFEVYDSQSDRGQKNNLLKSHAELASRVVAELSEVYEAWWREISPGQVQFPPMVLGVMEEDVLFSHDWIGEDMAPWNPNLIKKAASGSRTSYVRFAKDGRYRFELRRWPREEGSAIKTADKSGEGKALSEITAAILTVEGVGEWRTAVKDHDSAAIFEVDAKAGHFAKVVSAFVDADNAIVCGAYYIYVRRL